MVGFDDNDYAVVVDVFVFYVVENSFPFFKTIFSTLINGRHPTSSISVIPYRLLFVLLLGDKHRGCSFLLIDRDGDCFVFLERNRQVPRSQGQLYYRAQYYNNRRREKPQESLTFKRHKKKLLWKRTGQIKMCLKAMQTFKFCFGFVFVFVLLAKRAKNTALLMDQWCARHVTESKLSWWLSACFRWCLGTRPSCTGCSMFSTYRYAHHRIPLRTTGPTVSKVLIVR